MKTPASTMFITFALTICTTVTTWSSPADAQPPVPTARPAFNFGPQFLSPQVSSDRHVTFRILATNAQNVRLNAGDIPGQGQGTNLFKGTNDVWEVTVGPVGPGAYRYNFNVDGLSVVDPRNPATSESNNNVWSLVNVPGSDFMRTRDVPHGALASVTYYSTTLKRFRPIHV